MSNINTSFLNCFRPKTGDSNFIGLNSFRSTIGLEFALFGVQTGEIESSF